MLVYGFGVVFVPLVFVFCTVSFVGSGSRNFAITGMWSILGPDVLPEKPCRVPVGLRLGSGGTFC